MCGIVAIWNRDGSPVDLRALERAVAALAHRGPDDEGYVLIDSRTGDWLACAGPGTVAPGLTSLDSVGGHSFDLALGHRRLAIVDASVAGHQPMSAAGGKLWIAFNGMIYNFVELRTELEVLGHRFTSGTDTEVVLHAYQQWGLDCVARFNGMWCFVIWDATARRVVASRDRIGIKPLVFRLDSRLALFASELPALAPFGALDDGIEAQGLHHYLSLMQVPAPYTIYKGVHKLLPARHLVVRKTGTEETRYWQPHAATAAADASQLDAEDAAERLEALLRDSVRLRLIADVPVGCFLSGGIDSGTIAALATAERNGGGVPTFSITAPSDPAVDESKWSRMIAAALGGPHTEIGFEAGDFAHYDHILEVHGEPFAVSSALGVYLVARAARGRVKVLLSGDGGDELFAGYEVRHFGIDESWDAFGKSPLARARMARAKAAGQWVRWQSLDRAKRWGLRLRSLGVSDKAGRDFQVSHRRCMFNDAEKRALYTPDWRSITRDTATIAWLSTKYRSTNGDRVLRRQLHDVDTMLHDEMTAKLDHATMACGIEGRTPMLDHRVVEYALSLPPGFRYADGHGKWLLRKIAARHLPAPIMTRPKRGFTVPLASWLRREHRELVRDTLSESAVRGAGIFDAAAVNDVLAYYERQPNFHTAHMVFTLLCFQRWYDRQRGRRTPDLDPPIRVAAGRNA